MSISLKQLEAFVWVADLGSFRRAAERLNTTQPNISTRIATLEQTMQVTLLERDAGSVRLTSKGQQLLAHARTVLSAMDDFVAAAENQALVRGVLRLGVTELIVNTWLRDFLKHLRERHENLTVEFVVDMSANLSEQLFSRAIDLAFHNGPFDRETTGNQDLDIYPVIWVAAPELKLHELETVTRADMLNHPILNHSRGTRTFDVVAAHFKTRGTPEPRIVPTNTIAPCLHMTAEGMGVTAVPRAMVGRELAGGLLVEINYPWAPDPLHYVARFEAERVPSYVGEAARLAQTVARQRRIE